MIRPAYETHPEYGYQPETSGFLGKWRMNQNRHNDYLLDRDLQKNGKSYTGILGIGIQDEAVTESMGADQRPHQGAPRYVRPHGHPPALAS